MSTLTRWIIATPRASREQAAGGAVVLTVAERPWRCFGGAGAAGRTWPKPRGIAVAGQVVFAVLLLTAAMPALANVVRLGLDRVVHEQVEADDLRLDFLPAREDRPARLELHAKRLRLRPLQQTLREVNFECLPEPVAAPASPSSASTPAPSPAMAADAKVDGDAKTVPVRVWRCEGPLAWRGGRGWRVGIQADEVLAKASIRIGQGNSEVAIDLPLAGSPLAVNARRVGVAWLNALLPQLQWQSGQVDATLNLRTAASAQTRWQGTLRTRALAAQSAGGGLALDGVELSGPISVHTGGKGALTIETEPTIRAGELLAGNYYLGWPSGSQVGLKLAVSSSGDDWQLRRFELNDTGVAISAQGEIAGGSQAGLRTLSARYRFDLAHSYARYLDGAMAAVGQGGLIATGQVEGIVELGAGGRLDAVDAALTTVDLRHPQGRYSLSGLDGTLALRRGDAPAPFDLSWRRLAVYSLATGVGGVGGESNHGELRAAQPVTLDLLGGRLVAGGLVVRPLAESGSLLETSLRADGIDMAGLVKAFGWPEFAGQVSGNLPRIRYTGNLLDVDGEIDMRIFDGAVAVSGLSVERPFGVAPALSANVRLTGLDLQPMTEVFGFGRIEGRLNGAITGLRLLDWRPVAFKASVATAENGRRRISQLAVEQLTRIGGGGAAAGIQNRLLGVFDSFSYRRLGLSCELVNDVCTMGGVDEAAGGYTILQGSGLPLITIRGFQTRVDWPVLVSRLQAAVSGAGPTVD